jgi:hypothetical protein
MRECCCPNLASFEKPVKQQRFYDVEGQEKGFDSPTSSVFICLGRKINPIVKSFGKRIT